MRHWCAMALALGSMAVPAWAAAPGFGELEQQYGNDPSLTLSRRAVLEAIPAGTPLAQARTALVDAGGSCRQQRRRPAVTRCLIHQYSFADGAADDIRWTISLAAAGERVSDVTVDRYVDRHGTN